MKRSAIFCSFAKRYICLHTALKMATRYMNWSEPCMKIVKCMSMLFYCLRMTKGLDIRKISTITRVNVLTSTTIALCCCA
jgi:hypothetical protein